MKQWELREGASVADELARSALIERRRRVEGKIEAMCRDVAHFNRHHAPAEHLSVDDERGTLAKACAEIGLDLAVIIQRVGS